ncbi:MAG: VOC family protein [Rhodobacterales bacterium]|nr:VOC family protein [Rhodobacterales bacterium]MDX5389633.1 VOC family protein [Rhodobacterales bacterium]MDX5489330.1 VOC family protein [Rhodobacterales bacterium]
MDFDSVTAPDFGRSLSGLGLNLLVRDVPKHAGFLVEVFEMQVHRVSKDFAIIAYHRQLLQLHADGTYHANPLLSLLPEAGPRGSGAELRLFETDPDKAAAKAEDAGGMILQPPTDKPHGLRETYIMDPDGYVWVASRPLPG